MFKKLLKAYTFTSLLLVGVFGPQATMLASAACGQDQILGIPTWHKYLLDGEAADGRCTPKIREEDNPEASVDLVLPIGVALVEIGATLGAVVAFVMVLWGSFNFLTALGEPDKAASARKTVQNAAIGLVILLLSTRIVAFVGDRIF